MRLIRLIIISYSIIFVVLSCKNVRKEKKVEDNFYTKTNSSWDAIRLPLIKPYELIKLNGSNEWNMNLQETPGSISDIKGINVIGNIIVIHSGETYCNNEKVGEAWFAVVPEKHVEKGFNKKEDFDNYIFILKISDIKFRNVDKVYDSFMVNKKIDWQSGLN